ncbi:MAG: HD domain-containing protein [Opitutaceae bacterium]|jgi:hypothetical protein|nr:HD domain-containing protein [Opitutaceae bacterium]
MAQDIVKKNILDSGRVLKSVYAHLFGKRKAGLSKQVFRDVETMFSGNYKDYAANDTPYHDFKHTVHVMVCFAEIMEGRHMAGVEPVLTFRQFELGLAAVLLHDTGYLKLRSDVKGTGAKYTQTHVQRSCAVAAAYLPTLGVTKKELEFVQKAIRCTAATTFSERIRFRFQEPIEGVLGCAVATADCLGQMSAPNYFDSLPLLFQEFEESDNFEGIPPERRMFATVEDLVRGTPGFWRNVIQPRLENDLLGVYRFLARPYPDGENCYVNAVNATVERIEREMPMAEGKNPPVPRIGR